MSTRLISRFMTMTMHSVLIWIGLGEEWNSSRRRLNNKASAVASTISVILLLTAIVIFDANLAFAKKGDSY